MQGLLLKWQEEVLPSAKTFADALHQVRTAEEQEKQLGECIAKVMSLRRRIVWRKNHQYSQLRVTTGRLQQGHRQLYGLGSEARSSATIAMDLGTQLKSVH